MICKCGNKLANNNKRGFCEVCIEDVTCPRCGNKASKYLPFSLYGLCNNCVRAVRNPLRTKYTKDLHCRKCEKVLPSKNPNKNKSGFCESCFQEMGLVGRRNKKGTFTSKRQGISIKYQSGWELKFLESFEKSDEIVCFNRPSFHIPYTYKGIHRKYYPDVLIEYKNGLQELIEIKPIKFLRRPVVKAKALAARKYCKQNNLIYKFLTESQLEAI